MNDKTKKILTWIIIILICILIPGIFFIQFFNWGFMVSFSKITIPSVLAGAMIFWICFFIIYGIYETIHQLISKKKKTA